MTPPPEQESSEAELERVRSQYAQRKREEHRQYFKGFLFHTSSTFMDYLHGDVPDGEVEAACAYEYARESRTIWEAALLRDKLVPRLSSCFSFALALRWGERDPYKQAAIAAMRCQGANGRTVYLWAQRFMYLESFPRKDWLELGPEERRDFQHMLVRPLPMSDVLSLEAMGVFDQFKAMAKANEPIIEDVPPGNIGKPMPYIAPILQCGKSPVYRVLFDLDFSETRTQLLNEFKEWLNQPDKEEYFEKHRSPKSDTGRPLDRLKDLAAWRLYRELENNWQKANEFANKHRKSLNPKEPRAFRDAKVQGGKAPNEADLFSEDAEARKAQATAWKHLVKLMPSEFAPISDSTAELYVQLKKLAKKESAAGYGQTG